MHDPSTGPDLHINTTCTSIGQNRLGSTLVIEHPVLLYPERIVVSDAGQDKGVYSTQSLSVRIRVYV